MGVFTLSVLLKRGCLQSYTKVPNDHDTVIMAPIYNPNCMMIITDEHPGEPIGGFEVTLPQMVHLRSYVAAAVCSRWRSRLI